MILENNHDLALGCNSTYTKSPYFVLENGNKIYQGSYVQCLCVIGALGLDASLTLMEINIKCNGFLKKEN